MTFSKGVRRFMYYDANTTWINEGGKKSRHRTNSVHLHTSTSRESERYVLRTFPPTPETRRSSGGSVARLPRYVHDGESKIFWKNSTDR